MPKINLLSPRPIGCKPARHCQVCIRKVWEMLAKAGIHTVQVGHKRYPIEQVIR